MRPCPSGRGSPPQSSESDACHVVEDHHPASTVASQYEVDDDQLAAATAVVVGADDHQVELALVAGPDDHQLELSEANASIVSWDMPRSSWWENTPVGET